VLAKATEEGNASSRSFNGLVLVCGKTNANANSGAGAGAGAGAEVQGQ
jgi:hypothetical protein